MIVKLMANQITIKNATLEIYVDELQNAKCDAIVIPSNSRLLPSGTLRCKVLKNAGVKVQIECNQIINKVSTIPVGGAIITSGGKLSSKNIIHANNSSRDNKSLMRATWNSLKLADKKGFKEIVFSPISKDLQGFSTKVCANIMIPTIKKYILEHNKNIKKIFVCLETLPDYKEFEKALDKP